VEGERYIEKGIKKVKKKKEKETHKIENWSKIVDDTKFDRKINNT